MYHQHKYRKGVEGVPFLDFYSVYPTKLNTDTTSIQSGYFEHLIQYYGAGFKIPQVIPDSATKPDRKFS